MPNRSTHGGGVVLRLIATTGSGFGLMAAFALCALSAVAWWRLERRRAGVLAAVGGG